MSGAPHTHSRRRGAVLIIVLWISLGLATLALCFGHSMMFEYRAAANTVAAAEADHAIQGALRYAIHILKNLEEPNVMPHVDEYIYENVYVGDSTFWFLGRGDEFYDEVTPLFGLVDEASKLNLNTATRDMLEELPGMTPELAGAIMDWRDEDSEPEADGAESETYLRQEPRYRAKDGNFETVEELRLLMGGELDVLQGRDENGNGILDPWEDMGEMTFMSGAENGRMDYGILEYLTIHTREPNKKADGSDRINVSDTEQTSQLDELFQETFEEEMANQLTNMVQNAQGSTFTSMLHFFIWSQLAAEDFAPIADEITVTDAAYWPGLINVNTASREGLACVPGIGTQYADQLVAWRVGKQDETATIAWVMEVFGEDQESATEAGPFLTTKSYQYSADIAAVGENGRGFRRTWFVVDMSGEEPAVLYRRDRTRLGWPLGSGIREDLAFMNQADTGSFF